MSVVHHAWPTLALLAASAAFAQNDLVAFESGHVRPLALSADGERLYAVNTPDNTLEVLGLRAEGMVLEASIPVGLEPIAVNLRDDTLAAVVNHLSDSVSFLRLDRSPVQACTAWVGDEPQDVVLAGPDARYAFVTTAHRGQNSPYPDGEYAREGIGRADVWVFDVTALGNCASPPTPVTIITLFSDKPRGLAVSTDGARVYAAAFHSGNRTTVVHRQLVCEGGAQSGPCEIDGGTAPGGLPAPNRNAQGVLGPQTSLIVQYDVDAGEWRDELGRNWNDAIRFELPDYDVFTLDAGVGGGLPQEIESARISGVGTVLFNLAVNPANGNVYVSNTQAPNRVRFEGFGELAGSRKPPGEPATVRGRFAKARVTVIDEGDVKPRHLNKHIPYDVVPTPPDVKEHSLATPTRMVLSADGDTLYVAAFGSSRIGVFDTQRLEDDTFDPRQDSARYLTTSGGGPSGLALDETRGLLYVMTRFDNSVARIDLQSRAEVARLALPNPEPASLRAGRAMLYDARRTSSNGEATCAGCHVFGDVDSLAWDLGDPDLGLLPNPNPLFKGFREPERIPFHPLKGPMTTQSLRGLARHGPMHWRGDRTGGNDPASRDPLDERAAFRAFKVAFEGLNGRDAPVSDQEMELFTDFVLQLSYPPNPVRALDNALTSVQSLGLELYNGLIRADNNACIDCHTLDRAEGFFGTGGETSRDNEPQLFKIPHVRNMYQKVGMFGMAAVEKFSFAGDNGAKGPQVRGFGFTHDGAVDTLFRFFQGDFPRFVLLPKPQREYLVGAVEALMMASDTDLAPIVGQQITLAPGEDGRPDQRARDRYQLLKARAAVPFAGPDDPTATECDLVAAAPLEHGIRRWLWDPDAQAYVTDAGASATEQALLAQTLVAGIPVTFTCVPPGSGTRIALDRDRDGVFNQLDLCPALADPQQQDADGDQVGTRCDNCPATPNPDQADEDGDGQGDACSGEGAPAFFVP